MRAALFGLVLTILPASASAETWIIREGACGEWRSIGEVEQGEAGVWQGTIEHHHVGGACAPGRGTIMISQVRAAIVGGSFFAARYSEGSACTYYGRIRGDRVRGFLLCEGDPKRTAFAARLGVQGGEEARPRTEDPFLDDPQSYEQPRPRSEWDYQFRGRPR